MALFNTSYPTPSNPFGVTTQLWARDEPHARELCELRGMGEYFSGPTSLYSTTEVFLPSEHLDRGNFGDALHAAIWLSMVAVASKTADPMHLLLDGGIVHELAHCVAEDVTKQYSKEFICEHANRQRRKLIELEMATPGFDKGQFGTFSDVYGKSPVDDLTEGTVEEVRALKAQAIRKLFDPTPRRVKP